METVGQAGTFPGYCYILYWVPIEEAEAEAAVLRLVIVFVAMTTEICCRPVAPFVEVDLKRLVV